MDTSRSVILQGGGCANWLRWSLRQGFETQVSWRRSASGFWCTGEHDGSIVVRCCYKHAPQRRCPAVATQGSKQTEAVCVIRACLL